ncbi:uncharacterized protein C8Q71DRAFT_81491 [Rhodofomes roseus]|uniref:Secreted protein n=1 Tax=Rhodofomes roseus TaxID=34475 RepID=A0ABQ8KF64_9APHY|nr:uncharacterized protein C8Q71DRAFT_81491 [Rhodofomes roseus]KAH9836383.1 hypothetical protein C8Q71DRAFT_81491 [Rhodofomes roseus]
MASLGYGSTQLSYTCLLATRVAIAVFKIFVTHGAPTHPLSKESHSRFYPVCVPVKIVRVLCPDAGALQSIGPGAHGGILHRYQQATRASSWKVCTEVKETARKG